MGMARPVVKAAFQARRPEECPPRGRSVPRHARGSARPGPARSPQGCPDGHRHRRGCAAGRGPYPRRLSRAPGAVSTRWPRCWIVPSVRCWRSGGACCWPAPWTPLSALAERTDTPVVSTLLGIGGMPESHPLMFGMAGMHGTVAANMALHHADLVIGVGMRFDDRWVGRAADFAPEATHRARGRRSDRVRAGRPLRRAGPRRCARWCWMACSTRVGANDARDWLAEPAALGRRARAAALAPSPDDRARMLVAEVLQALKSADRRRSDLRGGRRPAPDVRGAAHRLRSPEQLLHQRRPRHDGVRRAGRDGCHRWPGRTRRSGRWSATAASR